MTTLSAGVPARCGSPGDQKSQTTEISTGDADQARRPGAEEAGEEQGRTALGTARAEQHAYREQQDFGKKSFQTLQLNPVFRSVSSLRFADQKTRPQRM